MDWILTFLLSTLLLTVTAGGFELPADSTQCVVGVADSWDSSHATLSFHEKRGATWQRVGAPWSARLGKNGFVAVDLFLFLFVGDTGLSLLDLGQLDDRWNLAMNGQ